MNRIALVVANVLLVAGVAFAQESGAGERERVKIHVQGPALPEGPGSIWFLQEGGSVENEVFFMSAEIAGNQAAIKNAPFSATAVSESTQTLADGNRITNTHSAFQARDSQGRIRREETIGKMGPLQVGGPKVIFISDPVAHTEVILQPAEQTARVIKRDEATEDATINLRRKLEALKTERRKAGGPAGGQEEKVKIDVKHEDLGMQNIEGLSCHGRRETVTIPVGQIGNERPLVSSTEIWTSDDLHGVVLKKHTDPRYGESVYRLTNIKLGEPDASLFQVPGGYKITTKTEPARE